MDGFQVAERLRAISNLAGVTVMMLASDARVGDKARSRELGVAGYLVKPVKRDRKSTRLNSSHGYISYAVFCLDRKSTRLNSSHGYISYAVFCLDQKSTRLNFSHGYISYPVFCLHQNTTRPNLLLRYQPMTELY